MAIFGDLKYLSKFNSIAAMVADKNLVVGKVVFAVEDSDMCLFEVISEYEPGCYILDNGLYARKILLGNKTEESKYTSKAPITTNIGGIDIGDEFNEATWLEIFDKMFYPEEEEDFEITTNLTKSVYEWGESETLSKINLSSVKVIAPSHVKITAVNTATSYVLVDSDVSPESEYNFDVSWILTEPVDLIVIVTGIDGSFRKSLRYDFVYPTFWGVVAESVPLYSSTIQSLNKVIVGDSRLELSPSTSKITVVIATDNRMPIKSIRDESGNEILDNFERIDVNMYFEFQEESEVYYVYRSNRCSVINFKLLIEFEKEED